MRYGSVKHIALYYKAIPGMLRLLRQERAELEGNYYGLRGWRVTGCRAVRRRESRQRKAGCGRWKTA